MRTRVLILALIPLALTTACASPNTTDGGDDSGVDAAIDAAHDAGMEERVPADAPVDVVRDSGTDALPDVATDVARDVVLDAPPDVAADASNDVSNDAMPDAADAFDASDDALAPLDATDVPAPPDVVPDTFSPCTQTVCGSECVDLQNDVNHCGGCDTACPVPANAAATCVAGFCGSTCNPGFTLSGGNCIIATPRLIAPLSTATVTRDRPSLHLELTAGLSAARVEICADRACTNVLESLDVTGTVAAPTTALPAGVAYWRAFGVVAGAVGTNPTPTWEFTVGARSSATDTSWGTTLDVNGDGYADLLVGEPTVQSNAGRAALYLGSSAGIPATPSLGLPSQDGSNSNFGNTVASAGDLNGDGFGDVVISAPGAGSGVGVVYVYYGSAAGITATPAQTLVGRDGTNTLFGFSLAGAGDLNGDGYGDLVVGTPLPAGNTGAAYVYYGSASGVPATPSRAVPSPGASTGDFAWSLAGAGDLNGDGFADLAIGRPGGAGVGQVHVYLGGSAGIDPTMYASLNGPSGESGRFGVSVASAGDTDGDGYADLVVGANRVSLGAGAAFVFTGSASSVSATRSLRISSPDSNGDFGISVTGAGDLNADGFADVAVGADNVSTGTGRAHVFYGSTTGVSSTPSVSYTGPDGASGYFGRSVAIVGDLNGDHADDLVVGAYFASGGRAYLYPGSSAGLPTTFSLRLSDMYGGFGSSIASRDSLRGGLAGWI